MPPPPSSSPSFRARVFDLWRNLTALFQDDGRRLLNRPHPFDLLHGTETSGFIPARSLPLPRRLRHVANAYAGVQPGILRRLLAALPEDFDFTNSLFLDLGCGKGRAMLVASEYPFRRLVGIEAAPELAEIARANAARFAADFPARTPLEVITGDAAHFSFEDTGDNTLVLFLYNSFGAEVLRDVTVQLEAALRARHISQVFILYHNAVHAELFDSLPWLRRWYADALTCDPAERGFSFTAEGASVIWHGGGEAPLPSPHAKADRAVKVIGGVSELA